MLCLVFEKFFSILPLWNHLLLNLDSSWCHFLNLEINLDLILILNLLTQSWYHSFGLFVIIKTTWINLIHHYEACFYIIMLYYLKNEFYFLLIFLAYFSLKLLFSLLFRINIRWYYESFFKIIVICVWLDM